MLKSIATVASIIAIPLAILLWIFRPRTIVSHLRSTFLFRVNSREILSLENKGLLIKNKELLQNEKLVRKKRYIYWPVVPTDAPNLIHATFIRYLEDLSGAGLKTVVFVFDLYYRIINRLPDLAVRSDMDQFISCLRKMGLNRCNHIVFYESSMIKNIRSSANVLFNLLTYFGSLSKQHIDKIASSKTYISNEAMFIRYMKPVLNMLYLAITQKQYGFTLSGYDERTLWQTYHDVLGEAKKYKLTNLYIPTMQGISTSRTNVLDKEDNITYCDSLSDIQAKIRNNLNNLDQISNTSAIFYALKHAYFSRGFTISIKTNSNRKFEYGDVDQCITDMQSRVIDLEDFIRNVGNALYLIFHRSAK